MCNTNDNHTHHKLKPELDRTRSGVRPNSKRVWTDLDTEYDRTRAGDVPNSTRVTTDFDAEANRTRHGVRPISTPSADAGSSTGYRLPPDHLIGSLGATGSDRQHRSARW